MAFRPTLAASAVAALLCACAAGPDYTRPALDIPAAWKEGGAWKTAEPQPAGSAEPWWQAYHDATLDALMADAERANQSIRQSEAQYRQARALADEARAGLFPTLGANAGAERARTNSSGVKLGDSYTLGLSASWEPDLWGSVRRAIESGDASAQASAFDLAGARLSIQTTLAQDYLQLRIVDLERALYADTTASYARSLKLAQAQHAAGVALSSDVAQAQSQLATAQAAQVDLDATRAQLEHAIAVLTGRAPAQFALAPLPAQQTFALDLPATPVQLPSALLEHRPDIAAAERRVALANANIGVAKAAYFPSLALSASGGGSAATLAGLFDTPGRVWALGAALAGTLFDGGLRSARTAAAVAAYDLAVAQYKSTVLAGFQQVEDEIALLRVLDQEAVLRDQAVQASRRAEQLVLAQYRGGTVSYTSVITAQQAALSARLGAVTLRGRQLLASVTLIGATGGGWSAADPASLSALSTPTPASPQRPTQEPQP